MSDKNSTLITNEEDWENALYRVAKAAAEARVKEMVSGNYPQAHFTTNADRDDAVLKYAADFSRRLEREYPFKDFEGEQRKQEWLLNYPANKFSSYFRNGENQKNTPFYWQTEPMVQMDRHDFSLVKKYLRGIAPEGTDYQSMNTDQLRQAAAEAGFADDFPLFNKLLAENQIVLDRANQYKEFQENTSFFKDPMMFLASIAYPTMFEEAGKQIATGSGTEGDIVKAGALDLGANTAMMLQPELRLQSRLGVPYAKTAPAIAGGVEQAAMEAGRQYGKLGIDSELDPNLLAIFGAGSAAATVPGAAAMAGSYLGKGTGEAQKAYSRGVMKGAKAMDPVLMERAGIERAWPSYEKARSLHAFSGEANPAMEEIAGMVSESPLPLQSKLDLFGAFNDKLYKEGSAMKPEINPSTGSIEYGTIFDRRDFANTKKLEQASQMVDYMKALGVPESKIWDREHTLSGILDMYDNQMGNKQFYSRIGSNGSLEFLTPDEQSLYRSFGAQFPAKAEELAVSANPDFMKGVKAGQRISDVFGRVEPTFKINPSSVVTGVQSYMAGKEDEVGDDYRKTTWYQNMSPNEQELVDKAFEKKKKEQLNQQYNVQLGIQ